MAMLKADLKCPLCSMTPNYKRIQNILSDAMAYRMLCSCSYQGGITIMSKHLWIDLIESQFEVYRTEGERTGKGFADISFLDCISSAALLFLRISS
ncbi:hypothetical protein BH18THE2_BH18THE2_25010 [soil metagenome]